MSLKISLLNAIIFMVVIAAALILTGFTFSRAVEEKGNSFIVDLHGEHWDVTQANSIGFDPERFRHGIGRNAFTPLEDRGQMSEDRCQRADDRGQRTDDRGQRADDRRQRADDRCQMPDVRRQRADDG